MKLKILIRTLTILYRWIFLIKKGINKIWLGYSMLKMTMLQMIIDLQNTES